MDIILRRDIKTKSFRLLMDVHKSTKREDIIAILMLAAENNDQITSTDISTHLIAERPNTVGERIIQRCIELGLLERKTADMAVLTNEGHRAVDKKKVFLPERGLHQIIYSKDEVLPNPLLDCISDDKKGNEDDEKEEIDPSITNSLENRYFKLLGKQRHEIFIENIERYGRQINSKTNLNLTYSLLENGNIILRLNGDFDTKLKPPDFTQMEVWDLLVDAMDLREDWDVDFQCLRRGFEDLQQQNLANFKVGITTKELAIEGVGTFNDVVVNNVPVRPRNYEDAQKWAIWLLKNEINDYMERQGYENIVQSILQKFPEYELKLPSQLELAKMIREEAEGNLPQSYWYLKAPIDIAGVV